VRAGQIFAVAQECDELRIDFDRGEPCAAFEQCVRQRAGSGPDFECRGVFRRGRKRKTRDFARGRSIAQKVLPVAFFRPQSGLSSYGSR
jgi:hypothetical protein